MGGRAVPLACITLDLEDDWSIPGEDDPTFENLDRYVALVDDLEVPLSVFAVGKTIERRPAVVDRLRSELDAEFHLHSYRHDMTKSYDFRAELRRGVDAFERHFGTTPVGYRAPQGNVEPDELVALERAGFEFDASVFPSYRPGVYNNLRAPLTPYVPDGVEELIEIPFAAVPWLRIPIAQNYLKLLGDPYLALLKRGPLPDVLVYDSHLQDFWPTAFHENLPTVKRLLWKRNIDRSVELFEQFVGILRQRGYEFGKISEVSRTDAWT